MPLCRAVVSRIRGSAVRKCTAAYRCRDCGSRELSTYLGLTVDSSGLPRLVVLKDDAGTSRECAGTYSGILGCLVVCATRLCSEDVNWTLLLVVAVKTDDQPALRPPAAISFPSFLRERRKSSSCLRFGNFFSLPSLALFRGRQGRSHGLRWAT